jgi:hypothetical protein
MPFHVEVRRSHHRAWVFNLDDDMLRQTVLEPWVNGRQLRLGERDWAPQESTLRILEGALLPAADLAHGQGWHHAQRSGRDVARELLEASSPPGAVALIAATPADAEFVVDVLRGLGVDVIAWPELRGRLLSRPHAALAAQAVLIIADAQPSNEWHFDAGLAVGAFGDRALLITLAAAPVSPVAGLSPTPIDRSAAAAAQVIAELLRAAGLRVRPPAPAS